MAKHAGESGIRVPPELSVLGKALLNLDGIGRILAPGFDPTRSIQRNSSRIMRQRMLKTVSPGNVYGSLLEVKDLVTRFPARVNKILDAAADNKLGLKLDTGLDAHGFMMGLQTVANRITVGLILAALIVGAAMLMQVPTHFTIFGYPGLAMLFFLGAALGGLMLLFRIAIADRRKRDEARWKRVETGRSIQGTSLKIPSGARRPLECGDLSPLCPLGRLVGQAAPRKAARETG